MAVILKLYIITFNYDRNQTFDKRFYSQEKRPIAVKKISTLKKYQFCITLDKGVNIIFSSLFSSLRDADERDQKCFCGFNMYIIQYICVYKTYKYIYNAYYTHWRSCVRVGLCVHAHTYVYASRAQPTHDMTMMKGDYNGKTDRYIMQ